MKLIKLKTDHYIIVDDSEIKEGDWYYWEVTKTIQIAKLDSLNRLPKSSDGSKKITHSTQPFNCNCSNKGYRLDTNCAERNHCFGKVQYLPVQEVKELIGEVDVEKKADEYCSDKWEYAKEENKQSFIDGYNQALEDNKDKKYTEEDLKKPIEFGYQLRCNNRPINSGHNWVKDFIAQSLQPKTEWEVEFINGKLTLKQ